MIISKTQHQQRAAGLPVEQRGDGKGKGTEIGKWYESWSTNLKGYKYKWNIKLKWISVI